jgi:hypothetical protein
MTPAKRRPATPASQGPTRTAPDVPIVAATPVPPADTKDGTQLLGPEGEPIAQEGPTRDAPPTEPRQLDAEDRATTHSPRRSGSFYPLPVWPD